MLQISFFNFFWKIAAADFAEASITTANRENNAIYTPPILLALYSAWRRELLDSVQIWKQICLLF